MRTTALLFWEGLLLLFLNSACEPTEPISATVEKTAATPPTITYHFFL